MAVWAAVKIDWLKAIKAIISGQVGTVPTLRRRIDTGDGGQGVGGSRARSLDCLVTGETADGVSSRSVHNERSLLVGADNPSPAYIDRVSAMEAIYKMAMEGCKGDLHVATRGLSLLRHQNGCGDWVKYRFVDATSCSAGG